MCGSLKAKLEKSSDFNIAEIVGRFKEYQSNEPEACPRKLLKKAFYNTQDFIEDAMAASKIPEGKTRLQQLQERLTQFEKSRKTPTAKALIKQFGKEIFKVSGVQSINVPFEIENTETGVVVKGSVLEELDRNVKQLTPVSSSNVRGVGQFGNELLVQFHTQGKQSTYRYQFTNPFEAESAYRALTNTGSPGRWIWKNIRGHTKGEPTGIKNVPHKYGPAITSGEPVIGGTTASLEEYTLGKRVPVSRVGKFEELIKKLIRQTSNPTLDPQTGQPIERLMEARQAFRDKGIKRTGIRKKLPRLDFQLEYLGSMLDLVEDSIVICEDCKEKKEEFYQKLCKECYQKRVKNYVEKYDIDTFNISEFKVLRHDFEQDFTILHGPLTRSGSFDYVDKKTGKTITLYKDWDNIKEIFPKYDYLPLKATVKKGAHHVKMNGFVMNWEPNHDIEEMHVDYVLFDDIWNLVEVVSGNAQYDTSLGFEDEIIDGNIQIIKSLDHAAMSFGTEKGRCRTGQGNACYGKPVDYAESLKNYDQNLIQKEVVN